jgi:hypothetical protein
MSGRVISNNTRIKKREEKGRIKAGCSKKPPGVRQSGRSREISVFPLTKLIMDVPRIAECLQSDDAISGRLVMSLFHLLAIFVCHVEL